MAFTRVPRPTGKSPTIVTEIAPAQAGFTSFGFGQNIQRGIEAAGYKEPRPIQAETIPAVMDGRDVLGLAQTGTGKTAAFALPMLERLMANRRPGPNILIIAPTRELAMQIHSDIETLGKFTRVRAMTVYGGVSMFRQVRALRSKPQIVVACPGRLLDLYNQGVMKFDNIDTVILDEADNMFDMGFLPDIRRILDAIPNEHQTLLFSATMPKEIRHLADGILKDPVVVELNHSQPVSTIDHELFPVPKDQKFELLKRLIDDEAFTSAIVFMRTKHRALRISQQLERDGHNAVALQGNMSQGQRDRAMKGFRDGRFKILVATDIAARGLDIAHVSHVINFDMPDTPDAYTHRIGRTGRAERLGKAYTFITNEDAVLVRNLERKLGKTIPRCQLKGFEGVSVPETPAEKPRREGRPALPRKRPQDGQARRPRGQQSSDRRGAPRGRSFNGQDKRSPAGEGRRQDDGFEYRDESRPPRRYAPAARPAAREDGSGYSERRPRRDFARDGRDFTDERSERRGPRGYAPGGPDGRTPRRDGTAPRARRDFTPGYRENEDSRGPRDDRRDSRSDRGFSRDDRTPRRDNNYAGKPRRSYSSDSVNGDDRRGSRDDRGDRRAEAPRQEKSVGGPLKKGRFTGPPKSKTGARRPNRSGSPAPRRRSR